MLKRRSKGRYLSIMHADESSNSVNAITKRFSELFGTIAVEKAAIRLVQRGVNESIIKCRLEQLENVLVAITLTDPPVVTIAMSGSIRQIRRRTQQYSRSLTGGSRTLEHQKTNTNSLSAQ
jgi:RNase P/RNase MRP subunit POP5